MLGRQGYSRWRLLSVAAVASLKLLLAHAKEQKDGRIVHEELGIGLDQNDKNVEVLSREEVLPNGSPEMPRDDEGGNHNQSRCA